MCNRRRVDQLLSPNWRGNFFSRKEYVFPCSADLESDCPPEGPSLPRPRLRRLSLRRLRRSGLERPSPPRSQVPLHILARQGKRGPGLPRKGILRQKSTRRCPQARPMLLWLGLKNRVPTGRLPNRRPYGNPPWTPPSSTPPIGNGCASRATMFQWIGAITPSLKRATRRSSILPSTPGVPAKRN